MDTITPLIPIRQLGSSTSQADNRGGGYQPKQGQTVQATVTKSLPNKLFEIDIKGSKLTARTDGLLKPGQTLDLQVLKTHPQVELKIVHDNLSQSVGRTLSLVGKNFDISSLFNRLNTTESGAFSQLNATSRQAITNFLSLQNETVGLQTETEKITQFIQRFSSLLQAIVTSKNDQNQIPATELQKMFSELAGIFKNSISLEKANSSLQQLLSQHKGEEFSALVKIIQNISSGSDRESLLTQLQDLLGITISSLSPKQIPAITNNLQNNLFALMHLLKGGSSNQTTFTSQDMSSQQTALSQKDGGVVLKQLVDKLGLRFEALLAKGDTASAARTLKAALLEITQQFQHSKHIAEPANRLLSTLELFQQAQLQFDNDKQLILPLPLPFLEQGYLVVDKNSDSDDTHIDKTKEINFSLHLSMKELGSIRVDFHSNMEGLYLKFNCESDQKAAFITDHQDELKKGITTKRLLGLSFGSDAEDPTNELIRRMLPEGTSILNTTV